MHRALHIIRISKIDDSYCLDKLTLVNRCRPGAEQAGWKTV